MWFMLQLVVIVEQFCLIFALVVVCVVGRVFIVGHYWFAFYLHSIAQRIFFFFSDTVMLSVTDINGAKVASTQVMLYKCRTATTYVHVRQNMVALIN